VVQKAFVQGVSTFSVDDLVQAMGMTGISKSRVSRLCGEIDDRVKAFLGRVRATGRIFRSTPPPCPLCSRFNFYPLHQA
jgi:transposase-like protein